MSWIPNAEKVYILIVVVVLYRPSFMSVSVLKLALLKFHGTFYVYRETTRNWN